MNMRVVFSLASILGIISFAHAGVGGGGVVGNGKTSDTEAVSVKTLNASPTPTPTPKLKKQSLPSQRLKPAATATPSDES